MSETLRLTVTVPPDAAGERADRFLAQALAGEMPGLTRSRLKTLIEEGRVSLEGATLDEASHRVKPGQSFAILVPEARAAEPEGQAMDLAIVYEDGDLIVIDKPPGLVVHPAPGNPDRTLVNALIAHCGESLSGIGGVRRPGIVHRLDKDTSGLVVVAKTDAAHQGLTRQFADRSIERVYLALVWGVPAPTAGEISGNIGRHPRNRQKMTVLQSGGKPAITRYRVIRVLAGGTASLVECRLLTGRTHQIRVHLAESGHPLIGDPVYGRASAARLKALSPRQRAAVTAFNRQALHAATLGFVHPTRGDRVFFQSDMPRDQKYLLDSLENV